MRKLLDWFFGLFSSDSSVGLNNDCVMDAHGKILDDRDETVINPATGLLMIGGIGGFDVDGNPYGCDFSRDLSFDDDWDFSRNTSFDDDGSGGFNDW
ncbi:hypothetical protein [Thermodesulforhabdus norvegica]|uniref:Uncharacterized protein n=1 Tax=Thermodesulforhabdus norvegica TaxID=39841 RepID=A0A1I4VSB9_9BACT|nr:hypothetical protein [Thermodesulforhabdus norvegica]SFN04154.1 hypothetical protein SAMN05660836_02444 [Thermodesulforhabdus norvegica]